MIDVSYLIVNTNGRELLLRGLEAVLREVPSAQCEVWVLDNASEDGSAAAVRAAYGDRVRLVEQQRRAGKAENDSRLLELSSGRWCLLLNEDSELRPGATGALIEALEADPLAAAAGAQLLSPEGGRVPCAWRFPSVWSALAGAVFAHRLLTVQSRGRRTRRVDWVQSSAMMVRREAYEEVGGLDPRFFVYSDEVDWCRRFHDAGWRVLYAPGAEAVHHEQLSSEDEPSRRRIVEFHRNRDLYLRLHHGRAAALAVRALTAWSYGLRALAALVLPGRSARRFALHARQALLPGRGEGIAEAAARYNAARERRA